jgi:hypothetical protein
LPLVVALLLTELGVVGQAQMEMAAMAQLLLLVAAAAALTAVVMPLILA